jgi:DNA invertase Pin-like site-specific DNA recombinase
MLVGYMRVSSEGDRQTTALQQDALLVAGVDQRHLFQDKASGARDDRPGLAAALEFARTGDCLVVWKLDRLGRSLQHLLQTVNDLRKRGVGLRVTKYIPSQFHVYPCRKGCAVSLAA